MRWLILLFLLARAECFADQFKVVTWNLDWFPGKNPASTEAQRIVHMSEAHDALLDVQPDILCLQEVRDYDAVQKLVDVLPRFQVHIVSRFKEAVGGILGIQQTAICGNIPAESAWSESWQKATAGPPRGFSFSAIRTSSGNYLLIYSVHFKSNLGQFPENVAKREEAARQLLSHSVQMERTYSKIGKVAVIVGGDYNTSPDDPKFAAEQTFSILRAAFSWCWEGKPLHERITIPGNGRYPDATFDGFFTKGCRLESVEVLNTGNVSDHRPVKMLISVP
jgi:endonuclease/exonuclease/phosphatase family metal-dependent hydrolase